MKKYRWGIIGPGKIAGKFAADLQLTERGEVFAVSSRNAERAAAFKQRFSATKAYADYRELLGDPDVDIVYVATPHAFHKEITIAALQAGKPVLCEKPMSLHLSDTREIIHTAREQKVFLMEATWTSCLPHYKYVREAVKSGRYGEVQYLEADFGFKAPYDPNGRLFNKAMGGGSLMDIGLYPVFAAADLLGKPDTVLASAIFAETGADLQVNALLTYRQKVQAAIVCSLQNTTPTELYLYLEKARIKILSRWHEPTKVLVTSNDKDFLKEFSTSGFGYFHEAEEVMNCLETGRLESAQMPLRKTLMVSEVIEQIKNEILLQY